MILCADGPYAGRLVSPLLGTRWFYCTNPWYGEQPRHGGYYELIDGEYRWGGVVE